MKTLLFKNVTEFKTMIGKELPTSNWICVTHCKCDPR